MDLMEKLTVLTDAAKYDVACTSSGVNRRNAKGQLGNAVAAGICHSFAADGRCVSLLKVLMTNVCAYDCLYCVNRRTNDVPRATFTPQELADLTIGFYRRNYIEGLFLSSAVCSSPDYTSELMIRALTILRQEYRFGGYIHVKAIPGADERLTMRLGMLADRMSVNIELPSEDSLNRLAPQKTRTSILAPMKQIGGGIIQNKRELMTMRTATAFAPAGQSTQMIVGASPESDRHILNLSQSLYRRFQLKRVFFSAYMPAVADRRLPPLDVKPPLLREHRLYQADWLMRFYGFDAEEILTDKNPNLDPLLDPKCHWALEHMEAFPVEVNRAPHELLLRVPGVGVKSAWRILEARRQTALDFDGLKKLGVVLKRARFFLTAKGRMMPGIKLDRDWIYPMLTGGADIERAEQLSFFDPTREDVEKCITGQI